MPLQILPLRDSPKTEAARFGSSRLLRDGVSVASSSIVSAIFGMALWGVAAHLIAPAKLGVMTAVLAAISTAAVAASGSIGGAYASLMPAFGAARDVIYRRGQRFFYIVSVVGGLIAGIATVTLIDAVRGSLAVFFLVAVGSVLLGLYFLQNSILTAIGRASWLVSAALSMNVARMALLCTFALTFKWHSLELSAVLSAGMVALIIAPLINRVIHRTESLTNSRVISPKAMIKEVDSFVARMFVLVFLSYAMFYFTPFLVTVFSGPEQGALFALSLPIAQTLDLISTSMGASLVVHASADAGAANSMARSVLIKIVAITAVGAVSIPLAITPILRVINPTYLTLGAVSVLAVLCAGQVARTGFVVWCSLQRAKRELRPTWVVSALGTAVAVVSVPMLSHSYGALGGAFGLALAYVVLSLGAGGYLLVGKLGGKN